MLFLFLFLLLVPNTGISGTLYVAPWGDDSHDGLTLSTALHSINAASTKATAGTLVSIQSGIYSERVITKTAGTAVAPIIFRSSGDVTIDGSEIPQAKDGSGKPDQNAGLFELRTPYIRLGKINIAHSKNSGIVIGADHAVVDGSEISDIQQHAISTDTRFQSVNNRPLLSQITLRNNVIRRATLLGNGFGQAISLIADGFVVTNNDVSTSGDIGIDIWLGATHGEVSKNTVHANVSSGIYLDGVSYVRVFGNKVFGNGKGIGVTSESTKYSCHDNWVYNNLVYDNTGAGLYIWDNVATPGFAGSQNILLANNTLVNNKTTIYLHGKSNSASILNNLGYNTTNSMYLDIYNDSTQSTYSIQGNVWLRSLLGFVSASLRDFHLALGSPAIGAGVALPMLKDNIGGTFGITLDYDDHPRVVGKIDAGAYEI